MTGDLNRSSDSALDHSYFRALEDAFVRLRGAPLLLSPADWQVAKEWRRQGIPLELAIRVLERIFERQESAEKRTGIRSLRYFRKAVEGSWLRIVEMGGDPKEADSAEPIDVEERLTRLVTALRLARNQSEARPASQTAGLTTILDQALERISELSGEAKEVEGALARIDYWMLQRLRESLDERTRSSIREDVRGSTTDLSNRLSEDRERQVRRLLFDGRMREILGLPVLSLFGTHAQPPDSG
ncbi:MAG: hypothetical protein ACE5GX_13200 [Thermoanaerobaculia bacterium]